MESKYKGYFYNKQRLKTLRGLQSMHSDYNFDLGEISGAIMKEQVVLIHLTNHIVMLKVE